jgi:hypothetical protein
MLRAVAGATPSVGDAIWGRGKERDSPSGALHGSGSRSRRHADTRPDQPSVGVLEWSLTGSVSVRSSWR